MSQLHDELKRLKLANPILVASGTFGYAREMQAFAQRTRHVVGATPRTLLDEIARQRPAMAALCDQIAHALGTPEQEHVIAHAFDQFESISIDYAVMEGAQTLRVIPAAFPWSDVGHWAALPEVCTPDDQGNVVEGARHAIVHESSNTIVYASEQKLVAALGVLAGSLGGRADSADLVRGVLFVDEET